MRTVQFRVSDALYALLEEEADASGASLARFAREATTIRAAIWANRNDRAWANPQHWDAVKMALDRIDEHDIHERALTARERRLKSQRTT